MSEEGRSLVIEKLSSKLRELEADLTVGNYFERIDGINRIKAQIDTLRKWK
jgi:hypothetical protein